jgi:hypothetical protein
LQSGDLTLIDVEPGDGKPLLGIEQGERKADVAITATRARFSSILVFSSENNVDEIDEAVIIGH